MKEQKKDDYIVRRENLSEWIQKFEDHCLKTANLDEDVKGYIEYSMKVCDNPRKNFHDKYLDNLDKNLNVPSSKDNYEYHDFFRKSDPYAPLDINLFKRSNQSNQS